jgi:hypothetical protein
VTGQSGIIRCNAHGAPFFWEGWCGAYRDGGMRAAWVIVYPSTNSKFKKKKEEHNQVSTRIALPPKKSNFKIAARTRVPKVFEK